MKKLIAISLFCLMSLVQLLHAQSQAELLKNFNASTLIPASNTNGKLEIKTKGWPITIERTGESISKIVLLRAGILEEIYQPDVPGYSSYFYSPDNRICYVNGVFLYYKMKSGDIMISYVLAESAETLQALDVNKTKQALKDYFAQINSLQKDAKDNLKEDLVAQKEKEKLENSIKGKNITKLEIVWLTKASETGMQSKIQFGIKAFDDKGKLYSTDNLGGKVPWEDFVITSQGAVPGDEYLTVETDASKIPSDKVVLNVKSKHHTSLSTSSEIKIAYATPVKVVYTGANGCPPLTAGTGTSGGRAPDAELNVCNSPDKAYVLIEVKISGRVLHKIKLQRGVPFYLDITGGPGCSGKSASSGQGGKGGNGGDGGNVTINKSAGIAGDNITVYNQGGRGGQGGTGKPYDGPSGSNGRTGTSINNTKSIVLNF